MSSLSWRPCGVLVVLAVFFLGCGIPAGSGHEINEGALDSFHAEDLNGKVWDLEQMKGQVVLIDFWATWCGPCVQELPYLKTAYGRHHSEGFEIIGVSLDDGGRSAFRTFLERQDINWPQIHEGLGFDSSIARAFGVSSIPRSLLLDRDGVVLARNLRGPRLVKAVEQAVRK